MTNTNHALVERAEQLAKKNGGSWEDHIIAARREAHLVPIQKLHKKTDKKANAADARLRKKAAELAALHHMPGTGSVDPDRRVEIGEVETQLGRVRVAVSRDSISIHGVNSELSELDRDLREAAVDLSATFSEAITDLEQSKQWTLIGFLMSEILRRHQFLSAKVKEIKTRERFDN